MGNLRIASESANVFRGSKSVEMRVPQTGGEVSNNLIKSVPGGTNLLFSELRKV